jgi:hypothetical protein
MDDKRIMSNEKRLSLLKRTANEVRSYRVQKKILTALLILLLIVRLRHGAVYSSYVKRSQVRRIAPMMSVCIFSLLCLGATDYIWSDFSTYYLFWCVFGIGSATLRIAKQESDDRELYSKMMVNFHESGNSEFSSIDVPLKKEK